MHKTLAQLASETQSELVGPTHWVISGFSDLISAAPHEAAYLADKRYLPLAESSRAGVIFIPPDFPRLIGHHYLITPTPYEAFQHLIRLFGSLKKRVSAFTGIHPTAVIDSTASLGEGVSVGPHSVIDASAKIGAGTQIGPGCYIGVGATIGENCQLHPHVTLFHECHLGARVILQPGVVIGSPGFGYRQNAEGRHIRFEHYGNVIIEDDVEIGANSTVDQAQLGTTRIRKGTKIDNLVQIAHNADIGEDNILVAHVAVGGSSKTGKGVILAGKVGVTDHVELAAGVIITACSAASKSLTQPGVYSGLPAIPLAEHNRRYAHLRNIEKHLNRISALEKATLNLL